MQMIYLAMYGDKVSISSAIFISIFAMAVVFVVLLIISYMIDITAFFINAKKSKNVVNTSKNNEDKQVLETKTTDDTALVAVIAAAVASYMNTNVDNIIIRKIRRIK